VTSWAAIGVGTQASPILNVENARLNTFAYGGLISQCGGCAANGQQFVSNGILGPFQHGAPTSSPSVEIGGDGVTSQDASLQIAQVTYESFGRFSYDLDDTTSAMSR
jgi:iron complex outermembrane recepter protein